MPIIFRRTARHGDRHRLILTIDDDDDDDESGFISVCSLRP